MDWMVHSLSGVIKTGPFNYQSLTLQLIDCTLYRSSRQMAQRDELPLLYRMLRTDNVVDEFSGRAALRVLEQV